MVNVDHSTLEFAAQIIAQDLHVTGQHHEFDTFGLHETQQLRFCLRLSLLSDGNVMKGETSLISDVAQAVMVSHDTRNLDLQEAALRQVDQLFDVAIRVRHHEEGAGLVVARTQEPFHGE